MVDASVLFDYCYNLKFRWRSDDLVRTLGGFFLDTSAIDIRLCGHLWGLTLQGVSIGILFFSLCDAGLYPGGGLYLGRVAGCLFFVTVHADLFRN